MTSRTFGPSVRRLGVLLTTLMILTAAGLPVAAASTTPSNEELTGYADKLLSANYPADGPGATALVVRNGTVLLRKGYGLADLELGVPMKPEMVFEIGSVTKQFTAAAILMLQERGKLSVQDDVTKYLPDYPTHGKTITLEHLLTHVSGIPSYTGLPEWIPRVREDITLDQLIGLFKDKPLEFEPGERWAYNNSAYILLGAVIEKVSGKSYEDFVEKEIFAPLGMKRSAYGNQSEVVAGRVEGYEGGNQKGQEGQEGEGGYRRAAYLSMNHPYAAGALLSSVDDLWLWEQGLASGKLLRPESLERMFTPVKLTSGMNSHYAYGWNTFEYNGRKVIEHGGGIFGFVTHVLRIPSENLYVAILSNNPGGTELGPENLGLRIAAKATGLAFEDRKAVTLDSKTLDEYVGVYRFDAATTRTITRENTRDGDKLFSQRSGGGKVEILPSGNDEMFVKDGASRFRFRRDAQDKVTGVDFLASAGADAVGVRTDEPLPVERKAVKVDPAVFDAYVGSYELAPGFNMVVTREGDQIFVQPTGQGKAELFAQTETEFFLKVVDAQITFEPGADGKATGLVLHQNGRNVPGKRLP